MSEDSTAKIDKKKKFRKRKREETDEDNEEEAELINSDCFFRQRLEETKILQQFRGRNKSLELGVETSPGSTKKKEEHVQSLGEQFTSQADYVDRLELKMHEYIEKRLASNQGGLVSKEDIKSTSGEAQRPSKAYRSEIEADVVLNDGKNNNAGLVQEVELPSIYKQQNIEETERARQKLMEGGKKQTAQEHEDVVPRFAKEKTNSASDNNATDSIAFERFRRNMTNK